MSENDIKKSLKRSNKVELIAWKVQLKEQVKEALKLIHRINREIKKR